MQPSVSNCPVIGAGETGAKVDENKHRVWTYQTEELTFSAMPGYREFIAISVQFPDGF
jgi:transposase